MGVQHWPRNSIGPAPKVTATECEATQNDSDSSTAWILAVPIQASLNWQTCLPLWGCRRLSAPRSPPKTKNRLNGDQVRMLITTSRSKAGGVKYLTLPMKQMLSWAVTVRKQGQASAEEVHPRCLSAHWPSGLNSEFIR